MLPPPPHNIILFKLDFDVKFPLLRLFQFESDLKSTIFIYRNKLKVPIGKNPDPLSTNI